MSLPDIESALDCAKKSGREPSEVYQKVITKRCHGPPIPALILTLACLARFRTAIWPRASRHSHKRALMIFFLTSAPLWLSGLLVVGLGTALSLLGPVVVRHYVTLERLTANNEIAGFKYAVVGVLYAVVLAFAIIVVWEKFNDAEANVAQEAGAATTIYRLSQGMGEKPGADIRGATTNYLRLAVIAIDRPFTGTVKVEPTALADVLADFGVDSGAGTAPAVPQQH